MITSYYLTPEGTLKQGLDDDALRAAVRSGEGLLWVDLCKPSADETFLLDDVFGFHPLAIEDCQHVSQYPKLDEFKNYLFLVFLAPNPAYKPGGSLENNGAEEDPVREIDLFLGRNYVVTYRIAPLPFVQGLLERTRQEARRTLGRGASALVHAIVDAAVDQFFAVVEKLQEQAEEVEDKLQEPSPRDLLTGVLELKRRVLNLRRLMSDHRETVQRLIRSGHPVLAPESVPYFRDVLDHLNRIEKDLDVCRETIDNARDVCLALANVRTNEVMRVLTVLFTLTLPIALLTSWYGMNFKHLPLAEHEYGALVFTGLMFALSVGLLLWLRRKKWL